MRIISNDPYRCNCQLFKKYTKLIIFTLLSYHRSFKENLHDLQYKWRICKFLPEKTIVNFPEKLDEKSLWLM